MIGSPPPAGAACAHAFEMKKSIGMPFRFREDPPWHGRPRQSAHYDTGRSPCDRWAWKRVTQSVSPPAAMASRSPAISPR